MNPTIDPRTIRSWHLGRPDSDDQKSLDSLASDCMEIPASIVAEYAEEWRRCHSQMVWQAATAIIGFAVAWDLGAKYYLVGGKEWVEP